ncbi:MAG: hypothetical protein P8Y70_02695 [Candidatus Lokiarchaeota archaeon]
MYISPSEIYNAFKFGYFNNQRACDLLLRIIDKSKDQQKRIESLQFLEKFNFINEKIYQALENLIISDPNPYIRMYCIKILSTTFIEKVINPIKWLIKYENDFDSYINIIKILLRINSEESHLLIIKELNRIIKRKYVDEDSYYNNRRFKVSLKSILDEEDLFNLSINQLAEILINYKGIQSLINKYERIFFEWYRGKVTKIDFSQLGRSNWTSWMYRYSNGIKNLSEIPEIFHFRKLESLNLSNNQINSLEGVENFKGITHLYLRNNHIENVNCLKCLKNMPNLKYLDLRGNKVIHNIHNKDFKEVNLVLKEYMP